ncbi:MAG: ComEC/Rec2 family competence protein [Candidatus Thorarchaeota archaeon]
MSDDITPAIDSLLVFILKVGDGDSIIVQLPNPDTNGHMVIDCKRAKDTTDWLRAINASRLALVVATHPHYDHIAGLESVIGMYSGKIDQFWDSGFRHTSVTWDNLTEEVNKSQALFLRPTSGMYITFADVKVTVLAPSIYLRNRYDSYGVNINNASIVLKLEYGGKSIILAGDAQWDSWSKMVEEFPRYEKTENPDQHVQIDKSHNPLRCNVLKVAHHGSKHGTALEPLEVLNPKYAIITHAQNSRYEFPHHITSMTLEEIDTSVLSTAICGNIMVEITKSGTLNVYEDVSVNQQDSNKFQGRVR